jgi:VanZ family protein
VAWNRRSGSSKEARGNKASGDASTYAQRLRSRVPLVALALVITVGSLWPGTLVQSWPQVLGKLWAARTLAIHPPAFVTVVERFVSFFPLGWLMYYAARERLRRPAFGACAAILVFSLSLELGQLFVDGRHARLSDCLLAMAFGALGVCVGLWFARHPSRARARGLLLIALVLGNATILFVMVDAHVGKVIEGWNCSYPLVIANEASADRPWRGSIRGLALYPSALAAGQVAHLAAIPFSREGVRERQNAGALMIYDFDAVDGQRVAQALPNGPADDLMLPSPGPSSWQADGAALDVLGPILIRGERPPQELCAQILASGGFAVEVEIASADPGQDGPARIVTQSIDPFFRNVMLGQDRHALVLRVRTPSNGPNGNVLELRAEDGLPDAGWHRVVAGYDHAVARLFVDGQPVASIRYDEMMWLSDMRPVRLGEFVLVGCVVLGVVVGWLTSARAWRRRIGCAYLGAGPLPIAVALLLGLQLGHEPDWWLVAAGALGPGMGLLTQMVSARFIANWGG